MKKHLLIIASLALLKPINATNYTANNTDYKTYLSSLMPGDTLFLQAGIYTDRLSINGLNGAANTPIVIAGQGSINDVVFEGNPCCNTISITQSSYVTLANFTIDGKDIAGIDGIKAEGTGGNWSHHITIDGVKIIGHGGDQQTVGISTKCPVWNWTIKNCIIDSAGTGMYLGNSTGDSPFVNGIVEHNLVTNTVGYNIQIKKENNGYRTVNGMPQDGFTIVRYNVLSKANNASSGGNERPNLLVGSYPTSGAGMNDYYEIYGNFFHENPYENLFQGTGSYAFYANIMVNTIGGGGMNVTTHDGIQPKNINIFHNTIVCNNSYGIRLNGLDPGATQHVTNNAVFAPTPIANPTGAVADNVTDTYANSANYLTNPLQALPQLDVYPLIGQLQGCSSSANNAQFYMNYTNYDLDFNAMDFNWLNCGAYTSSGINPGWTLKLENRPPFDTITTGITANPIKELSIYPNPANDQLFINATEQSEVNIYAATGELMMQKVLLPGQTKIDVSVLPSGVYFINFNTTRTHSSNRLVIIR